MTALQRLDKWTRKHYAYKLVGGPFTQPGSGNYIRLESTLSGRRVELIEWGDYASLDHLVNAALDEWYADRSPKTYRVLIETTVPPEGARVLHGDRYLVIVAATSEEEAEAKAGGKVIELWEIK